MTNQEQPKAYVIQEQQLVALQEFLSSLSMPWKQINPYMQLLISLPEVKVGVQPATRPAIQAPEDQEETS